MVEETKYNENDLNNESFAENTEGAEDPVKGDVNPAPDSSDQEEFDGDERRGDSRRKGARRKKDEDEKEKTISDLQGEITKKNEEVDSLKDLLLRRQADFENFKKRNAKLQEDFKKHAIKNFAYDIILINDDLLRAVEASDNVREGESIEEAHKSFVMGVSMISKRIEETLGKYGIMEVESLGGEFDPNFHEAVEIETSDAVSVDTVTKVYQKGFKIDEMVVRSAKVRVAKPVKPDAGKTGESDESDENSADSE